MGIKLLSASFAWASKKPGHIPEGQRLWKYYAAAS